MRCIYLDKNGICRAQPPHVEIEFKPESEMLDAYCFHDTDMRACPRAHMYEDYLEALGKQKK